MPTHSNDIRKSLDLEDSAPLSFTMGLAFLSWALICGGIWWVCYDLYIQKITTMTETVAIASAMLLAFAVLLASATAIHSMRQADAARTQVSITRHFEQLKLTRELFVDPEIRVAADWIDEVLRLHNGDFRSAKKWLDSEIDKAVFQQHACNAITAVSVAAEFYCSGAVLKPVFYTDLLCELVSHFFGSKTNFAEFSRHTITLQQAPLKFF
jgi:hypothetical protein